MLYALLIAATLGADDFDTRDRWTRIYKSTPLGYFVVVPALWDDDPEVNYRARLVTGIHLPDWLRDRDNVRTVMHLCGCPHDAVEIERLAVYYGDQTLDGGKAGYRAEKVARLLGLVEPGNVMPWGTDAARRWIWWCRARHAGLDPAGTPAFPHKDFKVPIPPPREKR